MFTLSLHSFARGGAPAAVLTAAGSPALLGPDQLRELRQLLQAARALVLDGQADRLVLTGQGSVFLAGADLTVVAAVSSRAESLSLGRLGHAVITDLLGFPAPTIAYLNGAALGGGLELALACRARVADPGATRLGLPEVELGLVPGWGGCFLLPHLVGPAAAGRIAVLDPLRGRTLNAAAAMELGLVDALAPFDALGSFAPPTPRRLLDADPAVWRAALAPARQRAERAAVGGRPAPLRAVELLEGAATASRAEAFAREDEALADLMLTDQLRAGLYAAGLKRAARPRRTALPVSHVGVVGGGLMATQLAALCAAAGLEVTLTEVDGPRAARARARLDELGVAPGAVAIATDPAVHAPADVVIEAVFEDMAVKRDVLRQLEGVVRPQAVLATNTSALSVTQMGAGMSHPERLVGIHFFNPIAQLPLVELVRTPLSAPSALDTARALAHGLGKTTVDVVDAPGFIVNRLLVRLLGEVLDELEHGTELATAAVALDDVGLPMGPLHLLDLVGPAVAAHVLATLRAELGERYPYSAGLDAMVRDGARFLDGPPRADTPLAATAAGYFPGGGSHSAVQVRVRVLRALAEEITLMEQDGVATRADIDLAMLTGAGWPAHRGGITPYLVQRGLL